jgi:hypothetical protein
MAFQFDHVAVDDVGKDLWLRDLTPEERVQNECRYAGEPCSRAFSAEALVATARTSGSASTSCLMPKKWSPWPCGDVDVRQVPRERGHRIDQAAVLVDRGEGVDQNGVVVAVDQRGGVGDPAKILGAEREVRVTPGRRSQRVSYCSALRAGWPKPGSCGERLGPCRPRQAPQNLPEPSVGAAGTACTRSTSAAPTSATTACATSSSPGRGRAHARLPRARRRRTTRHLRRPRPGERRRARIRRSPRW